MENKKWTIVSLLLKSMVILSLASILSLSWGVQPAQAKNGDVIYSFSVPYGPEGLAWDGTYLWHADSGTEKIYKINVESS